MTKTKIGLFGRGSNRSTIALSQGLNTLYVTPEVGYKPLLIFLLLNMTFFGIGAKSVSNMLSGGGEAVVLEAPAPDPIEVSIMYSTEWVTQNPNHEVEVSFSPDRKVVLFEIANFPRGGLLRRC